VFLPDELPDLVRGCEPLALSELGQHLLFVGGHPELEQLVTLERRHACYPCHYTITTSDASPTAPTLAGAAEGARPRAHCTVSCQGYRGPFAGKLVSMSGHEEAVALVKSIKSLVSEHLQKVSWEELAGLELQKELRIDLRHYLEPPIAFVVERVSAGLLETLSVPELTVFQGGAQALQGAVAQLKAYNSGARQPDYARERLNGTVQNIREQALAAQRVLLPFAGLNRNDNAQQAAKLVSELEAVRKQLEEDLATTEKSQSSLAKALADVGGLRLQTEAALTTATTAAAHRTATDLSSIFGGAAKQHEKAASTWLTRTMLIAAVMLFLAVCTAVGVFGGPPFPEKEWFVAGNLGYFATRVLIASIFSFMLVVSVRNHKAAMHNRETNAHRGRALDAFHGFESSAREGRAKDVILVHAADAVFSAQASGYAAGEPLGATHVGELLASVKEPPSSGNG
jgi:hypothetical protein